MIDILNESKGSTPGVKSQAVMADIQTFGRRVKVSAMFMSAQVAFLILFVSIMPISGTVFLYSYSLVAFNGLNQGLSQIWSVVIHNYPQNNRFLKVAPYPPTDSSKQ